MLKTVCVSRDIESLKFSTHVNAEEAGHPVQVVLVPGHGDHLGDDRLLGPVGAELLNLSKENDN